MAAADAEMRSKKMIHDVDDDVVLLSNASSSSFSLCSYCCADADADADADVGAELVSSSVTSAVVFHSNPALSDALMPPQWRRFEWHPKSSHQHRRSEKRRSCHCDRF